MDPRAIENHGPSMLYYAQPSLWGREPALYQRRVQTDITNLLPSDTKSVLDVGCGDGFITNALSKRLRVVGLDVSLEALKYVETWRACGSISRLPFAARSFDLVMANDVIEHVPEACYQFVLHELQSVAERYIMITVPFMENLGGSLTQCEACGCRYHVNHHYRSFGIVELSSLLGKGFHPVIFVFSGQDLDPVEVFTRCLRDLLGLCIHSETAICPSCGAKSSFPSDSDEGSLIDALARQIPLRKAIFHPNRSECIALFARGEVPPSIGEKPELRIVFKRNGTEFLYPTTLIRNEERLVAHVPDLAGSLSADGCWLEWKLGGIIYRYPHPIQWDNAYFQVPAWFHPDWLGTFTPSRAFWTGEGGTELLWQALRSLFQEVPRMRKEIELRRGFRGAWRTILERLSIRELDLAARSKPEHDRD